MGLPRNTLRIGFLFTVLFTFGAQSACAAPEGDATDDDRNDGERSTQAYGAMIQPVNGRVTGVLSNRCGSYDWDHYGIDITNNSGQSIIASYSGTVTTAGYHSGYGNYVVIDHGAGYTTLYAHMNSTPAVARGAWVNQGQLLGYVGNTGNSYGAHLHFEIRHNGSPSVAGSGYSCGQTLTQGAAIPLDPGGLPSLSDRSYSLTTGGTLQGKLSLYAPVVNLRSGIVAADADGNTVAAVDSAGTVWVQRGDFKSGWVGLASNAKGVAVDGDRFVVLHKDGTVTAKDGLYSTQWTTQAYGVAKIDAAAGRIGILGTNGVLSVKEGTLWAGWVKEMDGASDFSLDGNRIGVVAGGTAYVKEGNLYASWVAMAAATRIEVEGNRVALLAGDGRVNVKEGNLYQTWTLVATNVTDLALSGSRIAVVSGGTLSLKSGSLHAGWVGAFGGSAKAFLN